MLKLPDKDLYFCKLFKISNQALFFTTLLTSIYCNRIYEHLSLTEVISDFTNSRSGILSFYSGSLNYIQS